MKNKFSINQLTLVFTSLLLAVVFLSSCKGDARESIQDGDFKIDFLFEKDGCKIYRFKDGGEYVYWSNCSGNMQSNYYESNGKSGHTVRMQSFTNDQ
jgi:hypothetical protein